MVQCTVASLPAGSRRQVRIVGEIAGPIVDSTRVVFGVNVDPRDIVRETSERDNFAFLSTIVRLPSDLQVAVKSVTSKDAGTGLGFDGGHCDRGWTVTVDLWVKNDGPYAARATTVTAAWPDGFRGILGGGCFGTCSLPVLGPGVTTALEFQGVLVTDVPGEERGTFTVDPAGSLLDPMIANNTITTVVCLARPNQ